MEKRAPWYLAPLLAVVLQGSATGEQAPVIEAITFALAPGEVYVPVEEARKALDWKATRDAKGQLTKLNGTAVPRGALRSLIDGGELIRIAHLEQAGAPVMRDPSGKTANVGSATRYFTAVVSPKRAEVNLATQRLRAWQGERLVLESRVSSGRRGSTPAGDFRAGPYKARRHYSSRYNNAPMPWSVQVNGHIFIHGFTSVPKYPASHGCIRLPLNEGNPARFFYEWIDKGTPIRIIRK